MLFKYIVSSVFIETRAYTYSGIHVCPPTHTRTVYAQEVEVSIYSWVAKQRQKVNPSVTERMVTSTAATNTEIRYIRLSVEDEQLMHLSIPKRLLRKKEIHSLCISDEECNRVLYWVPPINCGISSSRSGYVELRKYGGGTCFAYEDSVFRHIPPASINHHKAHNQDHASRF